MGERIKFHMQGTFQVVAADGRDLTPASAKARSLLALLAMTPECRRSRTWLHTRLWHDRTPDKAAGSLRQCLLEVRRALGDHADLLKASRSHVALDPNAISVSHTTAAGEAADLVADLAGKDATLAASIAETRRRFQSGPGRSAASRLSVVVDVTTGDGGRDLAQGAFLRDLLIRSLTESADVTVISSRGHLSGSNHGPALLIALQTLDTGHEQRGISARIEDLATLRCFWSAMVPPGAAVNEVSGEGSLRFVHNVVQATLDVIASGELNHEGTKETDAAVLAASAVRKMFSMQHDELSLARGLLDRAIALKPRGLHYAWRAQLATISVIELHGSNADALKAEADEDVARALAREPMNSNVLACASNVRRSFDKDFEAALVLARQSTLANPGNPLGWWALASAQLYIGRKEEAYRSAARAQMLADRTSIQAWADFQLSLTAAVNRKYDVAMSMGLSSHTFAPHFRAPLRYLIAVSSQAGQAEACVRATTKLRKLEPKFSIRQLWADPAYPVSMMRASNLVDPQVLLRVEDKGLAV